MHIAVADMAIGNADGAGKCVGDRLSASSTKDASCESERRYRCAYERRVSPDLRSCPRGSPKIARLRLRGGDRSVEDEPFLHHTFEEALHQSSTSTRRSRNLHQHNRLIFPDRDRQIRHRSCAR